MECNLDNKLARYADRPIDRLALDTVAADGHPDAVIWLDTDLRVTLWNSAAAKLYGIPATSAVGRRFCELVTWHPGPVAQSPNDGLPSRKLDLPRGPSTHLVQPGRLIPVYVSLVPFARDGGEHHYLLVVREHVEHYPPGRYLQERLEFETLLSEMSARFSGLAEEEVDGEIHVWLRRLAQILGVDRCCLAEPRPNGDLVVTHTYTVQGFAPYQNGAINETMPWLAREFCGGRTVMLSRIPDDLPEAAAEERRVMTVAGMVAGIGIPISIGGSVVCVLTLAVFREPCAWSNEVVARLHLAGEMFANAIARRQAKRRLAQKQKELVHVGRVAAMGELASVIAHELDQPLTAVVTNAQAVRNMLMSPKPDLAFVDEALSDVVDAAMRVSDIIQRERRLLRKSQGEFEPVDLNEALKEVELFVRAEAVRSGVKVSLELLPVLPTVAGDRVQLQQVALNLARNGLQAMKDRPAGARALTIRTEADAESVILSVTDSGPPVREEMLDKMFEPFFTTKADGLGLGLAITRSIVDGHQGKIWPTRNDGGGLTMCISLPRK